MLEEMFFESTKWGDVIEIPSSRALRSTAHVIGGKYPCRSIALIPRMILSELAHSKKNLNVLDPFMGSGTTAVETAMAGFTSFGLEVDPYARLISNLSIHKFSSKEIMDIYTIKTNIIDEFPSCIPDISLAPNMGNISYWFSDENFSDMLKLKTVIHMHTIENQPIRSFFLAILADIVRAVSKAERQSLKPYISTRYVKVEANVLLSFEKAFTSYCRAIENSVSKLNAKINWLDGDATQFKSVKKMDVAITSPPYINAMDYVRCIKFESAWIGTGSDAIFKQVRRAQVGEGARAKVKSINSVVEKIATPYLEYLVEIDMKRFNTAMAYFQDMHDNLWSVKEALKPGASYHLIIGNSVIRGKDIPTHEIIASIGEEIGFKWQKYLRYPIKDHRTSLPRNGKGGKIAEEHVISLINNG